MTRGHTPPDSLTADDILALAEVRRDIWTNGFYGFLGGGASGYLLHKGAAFARLAKANRNAAFASTMVGAALGSFLLSTTTGKKSVHNLHPIFERGAQHVAVPDENKKESYQEKKARATRETSPEPNVNRQELERNRILRRASLSQSLKQGQGLSDSHGGHWVEDKFDKG